MKIAGRLYRNPSSRAYYDYALVKVKGKQRKYHHEGLLDLLE